MAGQWYVQDNQRAAGPFTAAQIKTQAENSRIKPETLVRKGARGNWVAAARVKGLLSAVQLQQSASVSTQTPATTTAEATAKIDDEGEFFAPLRNRRKRFIIFALLVGFALIGPSPWLHKAIFFLSMGLIFGSYPIVQVKQRTIEQTMIVGFFPVRRRSWKLRQFISVETDAEPRITQAVGCLVFIILPIWLMFRLFDHLMPWLGGDHKLWLRRHDDERLQIWQGNNTDHFEANLKLLESTELPIR
jgi:hypothetical protein